jgi:hypothetical protein
VAEEEEEEDDINKKKKKKKKKKKDLRSVLSGGFFSSRSSRIDFNLNRSTSFINDRLFSVNCQFSEVLFSFRIEKYATRLYGVTFQKTVILACI